jgi:hypothetical protein
MHDFYLKTVPNSVYAEKNLLGDVKREGRILDTLRYHTIRRV